MYLVLLGCISQPVHVYSFYRHGAQIIVENSEFIVRLNGRWNLFFLFVCLNKHLPANVAMGITGLHIHTKLPVSRTLSHLFITCCDKC